MNKVRFIISACFCALLLTVSAAPVLAAEADPAAGSPVMEIDLGSDGAGAEFYLKTDAGIMPGTLRADGNGILNVELGGSSRYVLTRAGAAPVTTGPAETAESESVEPVTDTQSEPSRPAEDEEPATGKEGKPSLKDTVIFFGGMAICGGFLLGPKIRSAVRSRRAETRNQAGRENH